MTAAVPHDTCVYVLRRALQFLKDLFPDMEKPDDVIGNIKSFFGMKDEEPPAAEEPVAEEPAPEEPAPADDESE